MAKNFPAINFYLADGIQVRRTTLTNLRSWINSAELNSKKSALLQATLDYATRFTLDEAKETISYAGNGFNYMETCRVIFAAARQSDTDFIDTVQRELTKITASNHPLKTSLNAILAPPSHSNNSQTSMSVNPTSNRDPRLAPSTTPISLIHQNGIHGGPLASYEDSSDEKKINHCKVQAPIKIKNFQNICTQDLLTEFQQTSKGLLIEKGLPTFILQVFNLLFLLGDADVGRKIIGFMLFLGLNYYLINTSRAQNYQKLHDALLKELHLRYWNLGLNQGTQVTYNEQALQILEVIHEHLSVEQMEPWRAGNFNYHIYNQVSERYLNILAKPPHSYVHIKLNPDTLSLGYLLSNGFFKSSDKIEAFKVSIPRPLTATHRQLIQHVESKMGEITKANNFSSLIKGSLIHRLSIMRTKNEQKKNEAVANDEKRAPQPPN